MPQRGPLCSYPGHHLANPGQPGYEPPVQTQISHLAVLPWLEALTPLNLSFHIFKVAIIITASQGCCVD